MALRTARFALQQLFPIQILLILLRFKLLPNFIFQWYRPQTWQLYLVFLLLSFLVLRKCQVLNLRMSRSHDMLLQRACEMASWCSLTSNFIQVTVFPRGRGEGQGQEGQKIIAMQTNLVFEFVYSSSTKPVYPVKPDSVDIWSHHMPLVQSVPS